MTIRKIAENIYAVGVVDWNVRAFHGHTYVTDRGTTYNAYLILDEKITLIDTVYGPFANELISNIKEIVDPSKIDYIIANHVETDHSGALPEILKLCPKAKVYGTSKCKEGLEKHYQIPIDFQIVKTGEKLKIGKKTLTFVEAPMIHWPDSMFTYSIEDQILFPNDAFGHHLATNKTYTDEVDECALWDECSKYYANILWPLGTLIDKKINDVIKMNVPIRMIAPSHGLIWRKNPMQIVEKYLYWAKNSTTKKIIIFYETMWNSTEKMAKKILEGVTSTGLDARLYDVTKVDRTTLIDDLLEAKGFLAGSSTHDNEMLPSIAGFLYFLKGLKPKNRIAAAFGSYGWAGGATAKIEDELKESGVEIVMPFIQCRFAPTPEELQKCFEFGKAFADRIKSV